MVKREVWEGGYRRRDSKGRDVFVIERWVGGRKFHASTRCHTRKAALKQLERFEANPAGYRPDGEEQLPISAEQRGAHQGREPFEHSRFGFSGRPLDIELQFPQTPQLIQPPDQPAAGEGGRTADPAQQAMHRRMHPAADAAAMVEALIAANLPAQQIAQQQLLGKGHRLSCGSGSA